MKRTIHLFTFLFAVICAPGIAWAQFPGDDFTSYIKNPGFEEGEYIIEPESGGQFVHAPLDWVLLYDLPGWKNVWADVTNDVNCPAAEGDKYFNCWASDVKDVNLYQNIKLPPGAYELTAMMRMTNTDPNLLSNQRIYASVGDRMVQSRYLSIAGVGREWDKLDLVFKVYAEDDSVTIGALSSSDAGTSRGWFQLDDVRITYYGDPEDADANILQKRLLDLNMEINANATNDWLTSGAAALILSANDLLDEHEATRDTVLLNIALDSMIVIRDEIQKCIENCEELWLAIDEEMILLNAMNTYPGFADLRDAIDIAMGYLGTSGQTIDGDLVYSQDVLDAIDNLEEADRVYRLTQVPTSDSPADYTFMIQYPNFTKKRREMTNIADTISTGWQTNNNAVSGDFRAGNIGGLNCWNNWSMDFWTMDLFQDLIVPTGIYSLECKTTSDGPVTDNHAYAKSTAGITVSPAATYWYNREVEGGDPLIEAKWEPLATGKVFVGNDGKLRIGFASTSGRSGSSGWFCATNFVLKYYGPDPAGYDDALAQKIEEAVGMCDSLMLKGDLSKLTASIEVGKAAIGKDVETIDAAFAVMNEAMDRVPLSYTALKSYTEEKESILSDLSQTLEHDASALLVLSVTELQNQLIEADTTTYPVANALKEALQSFQSYIKRYDTAPEFIAMTDLYTTENIETLEAILAEQTQTLEKSVVYKKEMDKLTIACRQAINALRTSLEPGEFTDFTFLITNPDINIEGEDKRTIPNGWTITRNTGDAVSMGAHYSGDASNTYLDSWDGTKGRLHYTAQQKIEDLPNGTYRLECVGRSTGDEAGAVVFAFAKDSLRAEIPICGDLGGSVWEEAEEGSEIKNQNNGEGFGWNKVVIDNIVVWSHSMLIGASTDPAITGYNWDGYWFSTDEFRLYYISRDWNVGVEDVNKETETASLIVYSENGYIVVEGEDTFTITTLSGSSVPANQQLAPGIYIVKAGTKTAKVAVQ